jgi:hypothetical protein
MFPLEGTTKHLYFACLCLRRGVSVIVIEIISSCYFSLPTQRCFHRHNPSRATSGLFSAYTEVFPKNRFSLTRRPTFLCLRRGVSWSPDVNGREELSGAIKDFSEGIAAESFLDFLNVPSFLLFRMNLKRGWIPICNTIEVRVVKTNLPFLSEKRQSFKTRSFFSSLKLLITGFDILFYRSW